MVPSERVRDGSGRFRHLKTTTMHTLSGLQRRPALRPLAWGILFALAAAPLGALQARDLDNQHVSIDQDHAVEAWRLINGSTLQVHGATTHTISVNDTSAVMLSGATVIRNDGPQPMSAYAMEVLGNSEAIATNTHFVDGGVWVAGRSSATLTNSHIEVRSGAPGFDTNARPAWGLSLNGGGMGPTANPNVALDNSRITVADRADQEHYSSGVGAYMIAGTLTLRNDSVMDAANVGVVAIGSGGTAHPINLELDRSHIQAGRTSGIEFAAGGECEHDLQCDSRQWFHHQSRRRQPAAGPRLQGQCCLRRQPGELHRVQQLAGRQRGVRRQPDERACQRHS